MPASLHLTLLILMYACAGEDGLSIPPFQSWFESDAVLPTASKFLFSAYNADSSYPECIFVFGGDCNSCFYCYNISNDSINDFGVTSFTGGQIYAQICN